MCLRATGLGKPRAAAAPTLIAFVGWMALALPAWCAPPLASDDASTLGPGECQFETEHRRFRRRIEQDNVPVCNLWLDTEIGIGQQRVAPDAAPRANSVVYQFKKVLGTSEETGWAFGIAAATIRASGGQSGTRQHLANALLSRQIGNSAFHLNVGVVSDRESQPGIRRNRPSWALATEHDASDRWTFVGEVFGQRGVGATAQVGLRWWLVPKYVQLTASHGAQRGEGRDGRWASLGVRFETARSIF